MGEPVWRHAVTRHRFLTKGDMCCRQSAGSIGAEVSEGVTRMGLAVGVSIAVAVA